MNSRISTTGVTTLAAVRPERGTAAKAMPRAVPAAVPSTTKPTSWAHFSAVSGSGTS